MQVFRELFIRGKPDQLRATAEAICDSMSGDWSRDLEAERRSRENAMPGREHVYSFKCRKQGPRSAVNLFLKDEDKNTLEVTNVVPQEVGQLTYDEYNGVMEEFFRQFVQPAVARTGARVEMTEAEADLERWVSPGTAEKLRRFCDVANRWSGSNHPVDRKLWYDFIVSAHREGSELDSCTLARWLHEDGKWGEEWADKLAAEYQFARGLFAHADKQTVGV